MQAPAQKSNLGAAEGATDGAEYAGNFWNGGNFLEPVPNGEGRRGFGRT
jgi:hypothetical protein